MADTVDKASKKLLESRRLAKYEDDSFEPINEMEQTSSPLHEKIARFLAKDMGITPTPLGVVAGTPRAAQIAADLAEHIQTAQLSPVQAAIRYIQYKYPLLASKINRIYVQPRVAMGNTFGTYHPFDNSIDISDALNPSPAVETLGHELTHGAIQATRTPNMIGRDYIPSELNYAKYYDQPAERLARQGGKTAQGTFFDWMRQYPELHDAFRSILDLYQPLQ